MAKPSLNLDQVLNQLNSGSAWSSDQITYSFPATSSNSYTSGGEAAGFSQLSATQIQYAEYAIVSWDDLIAPDLVEASGKTNIEVSNTTTGIDYAHAYYPNLGSVWFNSDYKGLRNPTVDSYDYGTYVHELGHAFGLNHMGDYNGNGDWSPKSFQDSTVLSIMSYFGPDQGDNSFKKQIMWADWVKDGEVHYAQTPMLNDIMAIQKIYGAETTTRTGDTVYGFNSNISGSAAQFFDFDNNENPILCIYDSSGSDTLDLSGFSTKCSISLVAGSFSDCNEMTNNISIAYKATIENAVGGSGNDLILGNALANILTGGGGGDTLNGAAGTDVALYAHDHADYTIVANANGSYTVIAKFGNEGTDTLTNIETLRFADGDVAIGDAGSGDIVGTSDADDLDGTDAADVIRALGGKDRVHAGAGDDTIDGGKGRDLLWGEAGADTFKFGNQNGMDDIKDFSFLDGDKIDLSGVSAITDYADLIANHFFSFKGQAYIEISKNHDILVVGVSKASFIETDFIFAV